MVIVSASTISNGMDRFGFTNQLVVKKSPVVIVKTFIVLQLTAVAVFFLASVLADYGEIYEHLPLSSSLSFHIVEAAGLFILETGLVFYIFFQWYKEYFEFRPDKIVYGRGIIFRKKTVIPLKFIHSVDYRQGPLGRLTKYGTIDLKESDSKFSLDHIPEPQRYAELIVQLKGGLVAHADKISADTFNGLLSGGEHERLEFKTSLRWDMKLNKVNKSLERAVMKTIAAFLNSAGGRLAIGVDDSGQVVGLENDYRSLPKSNADGFQNHFTNIFHSMIGPEFRQFVDLSLQKKDGKDFCLVNVLPADRPAYLRTEENEDFFIRTGNGTTSLKLSEAASYIDSHWRGKLL
ncbi:MAG: putative DNA binding domain-containing protein [Candidatus Yanofskybacteria bacterium]|nr:putative DNA binding domain-containing protein [Candidatus Yanofskybacteria bacterium]